MTKPPLDSEPPRTYSSLVLCIAAAFSTMTYASPGAILEPKKKYKFANDTYLTIIEETLTEVILKINEKQEKYSSNAQAKQYIAVPSSSSPMQKAVRYSEKPMENTIATH